MLLSKRLSVPRPRVPSNRRLDTKETLAYIGGAMAANVKAIFAAIVQAF